MAQELFTKEELIREAKNIQSIAMCYSNPWAEDIADWNEVYNFAIAVEDLLTSLENSEKETAETLSKSYPTDDDVYNKEISLGASDIGVLTITSWDEPSYLGFGEDGSYFGTIVDSQYEVPENEYELMFDKTTWIKVFDDTGLVLTVKADKIRIYRGIFDTKVIIQTDGLKSVEFLNS